MKSRAQLVDICGAVSPSGGSTLKAAFFSVTSKVTNVMTGLRQLEDHVRSVERILSEPGVLCSLPSPSDGHSYLLPCRCPGFRSLETGQQGGGSRPNTQPIRRREAGRPGSRGGSRCVYSTEV